MILALHNGLGQFIDNTPQLPAKEEEIVDRYVILGCGVISSAIILSQTASYAREGNYTMATKFAALATIPVIAVAAQISELFRHTTK